MGIDYQRLVSTDSPVLVGLALISATMWEASMLLAIKDSLPIRRGLSG